MSSGRRLDRIIRLKSIEKEYRVAVVARELLKAELKKAPSTLTDEGLERSHFDDFCDNLDSTYLTRIFAEFEMGLRDFWKERLKKKAVARVSDMIKSISSSQRIGRQEMENVEDVRKYRNKLIHEGDSEARAVAIGEARSSLCKFFGRLPEDW